MGHTELGLPYTTAVKTATRRADEQSVDTTRRRHRTLAGLALLLLVIGTSAWWLRFRDGHLNAVRELRKQAFGPAARQLPADERRQKFEQLRAEEMKLSPEDRRTLRSEGMRRQTEQLNRYFTLSKAEKMSMLDEAIAREQRRQKEMQERQSAGDGAPGDTARSSAASRDNRLLSAAERDKRREDFLDSMPAMLRAEWTEFRKDLGARRLQLGLPPTGRP